MTTGCDSWKFDNLIESLYFIDETLNFQNNSYFFIGTQFSSHSIFFTLSIFRTLSWNFPKLSWKTFHLNNFLNKPTIKFSLWFILSWTIYLIIDVTLYINTSQCLTLISSLTCLFTRKFFFFSFSWIFVRTKHDFYWFASWQIKFFLLHSNLFLQSISSGVIDLFVDTHRAI